jgi:beta-mannosidase
MARIVALDGQSERRLETDWLMAITADAACATPRQAVALLDWLPAHVPATAASILGIACDGALSLHDQDVWWRLSSPPSGHQRMRFDGLATLCEIWLEETLIARSTSMFVPLEVEADIPEGAELWLCFRAMTDLFERKLPRARWRPRMIPQQALRGVRTTLLGQMPGWTPPIDAVGPFRPITAVTPAPVTCRRAWISAALDEGGVGRLSARIRLDGADHPPILRCAGAEVALQPASDGGFEGDLTAPGVEPWWPHTHGDQPLYPVTLVVGETIIDLGHTGFRDLRLDRGLDGDAFQLVINGQPIFCRGAVWTSADVVGLGGDRATYEPWLRLAREAGMNMLRMSGTGVYESPDFFALCDELGILVWQDFMFANFDYPIDQPEFAQAVEAETEAFLDRIQLSPSLAVLCGGSEVKQQATMLGLRPEATAHALFDAVLPRAAQTWRPDVAYVDNSPSGGALPFVTDVGVAHYFGVGAYRRTLDDARRADVKFAGECLGFSNIPEPETLREGLPGVAPGSPAWKAATQRDLGADWDFEDIRDHYLATLRGVDPARLMAEDPALYLDLGRAVTGEAMTAVFAEWRRIGSRCGGGLVWTLQDLRPGAGWGVIDSLGRPKQAWYALKRALQPLHLGLTDEGGNGLHIHLRNETARDEVLDLELVCLRDGATQVLRAARRIELPARGAVRVSSFALIGAFFDITYAYRFGPLGHDATVVSLRRPDETRALAEAFHYPPGAAGAHVEAKFEVERIETPTGWSLDIATDRLLRDVRIAAFGYRPLDDGFDLAPGRTRRIELVALSPAAPPPVGEAFTPGRRVTARFGS